MLAGISCMCFVHVARLVPVQGAPPDIVALQVHQDWCANAGIDTPLQPPWSPSSLRRRLGPASARRLQAAVAQGILNLKFKTEPCTNRPCRRGAECWFYHSEEDRLPLLGYKAQFCKAWQARGGGKAHARHAVTRHLCNELGPHILPCPAVCSCRGLDTALRGVMWRPPVRRSSLSGCLHAAGEFRQSKQAHLVPSERYAALMQVTRKRPMQVISESPLPFIGDTLDAATTQKGPTGANLPACARQLPPTCSRAHRRRRAPAPPATRVRLRTRPASCC